jgi:hypothetical protein
VFEDGAEGNIGTREGLNDRRLEGMHNEELHNLYASPSIIRMIKSGRKKWAVHVACRGEESMQNFGGKTRTNDTIRKTKT